MSTETQKVDVLAVLSLHAEMREAAGKPNLANELRSARDAIADLIEAAKKASFLITQQAALIEGHRMSGEASAEFAREAVRLLHEHNHLVLRPGETPNPYHPGVLDVAIARVGGAA